MTDLAVKALCALALSCGLFVWGLIVGTNHATAKVATANAAIKVAQAQQSAALAVKINTTQVTYDNAVKSLQTSLADMLQHDLRLRKRADRVVPVSTAASGSVQSCAGSTGADLSTVDAEFLRRYSTAADGQALALAKCYADLDDVTSAIQQSKVTLP